MLAALSLPDRSQLLLQELPHCCLHDLHFCLPTEALPGTIAAITSSKDQPCGSRCQPSGVWLARHMWLPRRFLERRTWKNAALLKKWNEAIGPGHGAMAPRVLQHAGRGQGDLPRSCHWAQNLHCSLSFQAFLLKCSLLTRSRPSPKSREASAMLFESNRTFDHHDVFNFVASCPTAARLIGASLSGGNTSEKRKLKSHGGPEGFGALAP
jgi:hypothetical protein